MLGAGLAFAAPAAADYPPKPPSVSVAGCSDVDSGVKVKVKRLEPRSSLTVEYDQISGAALFSLARAATSGTETATANAGGNVTITLPITEAGTYSITALGTDEGGNAWTGSTTTQVVGSCDDAIGGETDASGGAAGGSGDTGGLADTGGDGTVLLAAGLGALVVGGGTVLVARRRRGTDQATA